ncbi:hypothetical protein PPYR_00429 [Photinus pyralis]|uniref:DNA-directed DNA polymerase n=1 Tax=Photinus pyralis TaxID=7054 RepID=A0A5N4B1H8_PHOPY|nr:hypothetical protein PPYR_00429 [Photinus pyralis]
MSSLARKNRDVVAIAHNSKGYDSIFILKEMMNTPSAWNPDIIATGTKITSLSSSMQLFPSATLKDRSQYHEMVAYLMQRTRYFLKKELEEAKSNIRQLSV